MKKFSHCNVLNLIGVCVDNGPVPLLVLPFMANGSLLKYLKRERSKLTVTVNSDKALVCLFRTNYILHAVPSQ